MTVSSQAEDSPDPRPPASSLRSMQTGQNSIAPENSLPQFGQVRWDSVLIVLTGLSAATSADSKATLHRVAQNRSARLLANCWPVPQAIACSSIFSASNHVSEQNSYRSCPAAFRIDDNSRNPSPPSSENCFIQPFEPNTSRRR
jgi:hypothetical protein